MENKNFEIQELIEKATSKKLLKIKHNGASYAYICPSCNNVIIEKEDIVNYHVYKRRYNYCHCCGQKLKYDEK